MAKSKGKNSRKKGGQIDEVIQQCPHIHFKTDVIDRNVLSKEQHLNLLSTPKGYRWEEYKNEGGDGGPAEDSPARRIMCSGRRMKKAEKVYVHNFLAEVWNLLTPEMVDRLKGMLMNEFGMSPQEADDFIRKQREENIVNSSTVSFYKKPRDIGDGKYVYDHVIKKRIPNKAQCDQFPKSNLGVRNSWIKDFSDFLSDIMSSYVADTMCTVRTERQQEIAQTLLNRFNILLEQKTSFSNPQTPTEKTMVLLADRLALWLDKNVDVSKVGEKKVAGKQKLEKLRKDRERKEANKKAKKLAAQYLAEEEEALEGDEEQSEGLTEEQEAQQVAEEDHDVEISIGEEEEGAEPIQRDELLKKDTDQATAGKETLEHGDKEQADQIEKEEREAAAAAAAEAAEKQRQEAEAERMKEEEAAAVAAAAAAVAAAESEEKTDDELREIEEETEAAEEETTGEQNLEDELKKKEEEDKAAAEAAETEKRNAEIEQEAAAKDALEAQLGEDGLKDKELDEKAAADAAEVEQRMADKDLEEAEKEAEKEAAEAEKLRLLEQMKREEEEKRLADLADQELKEDEKKEDEVELLPEEIDRLTREVLNSVASIILETKSDPTPRQEAIKDIMEKHLEENLGDEDKEAIDKVASKVGTWIDKMVDQATQEYGQRESRGQLQGAPSKLGGSSAPQSGGVQDGFGLGRTPGDIRGPPDSPSVHWTQESIGFDEAGSPLSRAAPVSQRPKGRIYRISRTDSGYDVHIISNTRAQGKIRLARGMSPAFENVPNPDGPMEPSDVKSWYKWTSALAEVAESWADWIKDTIKGAQQRGERLSRDNSPDRMKEWKEFRESRAQGARKWGQTKKDMEDRAKQWSKKGRKVHSQ